MVGTQWEEGDSCRWQALTPLRAFSALLCAYLCAVAFEVGVIAPRE
jgi:hypothetical protein